MSLMHR